MNSYEKLALIYEEFMQDAPYEEWMEWLLQQFGHLSTMQIADIGCGTGTLTRMLASQSPSVVGIEPSDFMLQIAAERAIEERRRIMWLCQDARLLKLPRLVDLLVSTCDTLNYLVEAVDFQNVLVNFWNSLNPGGVVAFDVIGEGRLKELQAGFSYDIRDEAAVMFETRVESGSKIIYDLHAFMETDTGLYERFEEVHEQRFYSADDITRWLKEAGFEVGYLQGDFGQSNLNSANRMVFSARKPVS